MSYKSNYPIDSEGYYTGPETKWNVEDVEMSAERAGLTFSTEDYERVLVATLEDNTWIMEAVKRAISETIEFMLQEGEIKEQNT
mgnify:CR=1 FL=1|tara:strand:+ start:1408 stop:1659 length:252 start_codon:yes stop_codon:yes gene_type:complete